MFDVFSANGWQLNRWWILVGKHVGSRSEEQKKNVRPSLPLCLHCHQCSQSVSQSRWSVHVENPLGRSIHSILSSPQKATALRLTQRKEAAPADGEMFFLNASSAHRIQSWSDFSFLFFLLFFLPRHFHLETLSLWFRKPPLHPRLISFYTKEPRDNGWNVGNPNRYWSIDLLSLLLFPPWE